MHRKKWQVKLLRSYDTDVHFKREHNRPHSKRFPRPSKRTICYLILCQHTAYKVSIPQGQAQVLSQEKTIPVFSSPNGGKNLRTHGPTDSGKSGSCFP